MKKVRLLIGLLCISFSSSLQAGGIKNGFKALSVYDYFKARMVFTKALKSKSSGAVAAYGLSVITSRTDNHFYNLDTAYTYILKAQKGYPAYSAKQKLKYKPF